MAKRAIKPTQLKIIEGNLGRRKLPESEPAPRPVTPKCPPDIDADAKKVWTRLAPKLTRLGLLRETDGDEFAMLCQIRARLATIHKLIKTVNQSLVQKSKKKGPDGETTTEYKPSPYVVMEKQYYQLFRMYAGEFGLSPRGRVGLSAGVDKGEDGADLLD